MDIFEQIERLKPFVTAHDWDGLESHAFNVATQLAGQLQANEIKAVDLAAYGIGVLKGLRQTVGKIKDHKAIYFEYDLDNDWQSCYFLCTEYNPESVGDDDWACEYDETVKGPDQEDLAIIYSKNGFDTTDAAIGATIFLISRTVATFGRATDNLSKVSMQNPPSLGEIAICIAFHDEDPIMRIKDLP